VLVRASASRPGREAKQRRSDRGHDAPLSWRAQLNATHDNCQLRPRRLSTLRPRRRSVRCRRRSRAMVTARAPRLLAAGAVPVCRCTYFKYERMMSTRSSAARPSSELALAPRKA
jgi:hypothetical protein